MYLPTQVTYTTVVKVPMLPLKITCGFHLLTEFEFGTLIRCPSWFLCLSPGDDGDLSCPSGHWTFSRSHPWAMCFVHVSHIPQHFLQGGYLYPLLGQLEFWNFLWLAWDHTVRAHVHLTFFFHSHFTFSSSGSFSLCSCVPFVRYTG